MSGSEFIQFSQRAKPREQLSFWNGDDGYYYLECHRVSIKSKPQKRWAIRTQARNLRTSDVELLERVNFKSTPEKLRFAAPNAAKLQRVVPTKSLAFHLQSLGRTPTEEERKVIEAALALMQGYQVRTDPPLRSVWRDKKAKLWELDFANGDTDGTFTIFLRDKDADWFYMLPTMLASRGFTVPPQKR